MDLCPSRDIGRLGSSLDFYLTLPATTFRTVDMTRTLLDQLVYDLLHFFDWNKW